MKVLVLILVAIYIQTVTPAPNSRIIGGFPASIHQYPFSAAIDVQTSNSKFFCGGTIYTRQFVITAGQCVDEAVLFTIRLGASSLKDSTVTLSTSDYFLHPDYNPTTLANDIGLIKFRLPIEFTDTINSINYLAIDPLPQAHTIRAIGWGQTTDDSADFSDELNYVYVTALSTNDCKLTYGDQIIDTMVCVEGNYNEGACHGDTGSPLVDTYARYHTVHVGVSSFVSSNGCESTDPSGYTRTYPYVDWIQNITSSA